MRNIAQISRRELVAHRPFDVGLTASVPVYKAIDEAGHKEWVVDVYFGPGRNGEPGVLKDIIVAPNATKLIGDIRQPVRLERSKQGKFTVVGRAKIIPAGAQMPDGSILEPSYHEVKVNLADLDLLFIPDLDFEIAKYGVGDYGVGDYAAIKAFDAFGYQVMGDGAESVPAELGLEPTRKVTTKHTAIRIRPYGEGNYGEGDYAGSEQVALELTEE